VDGGVKRATDVLKALALGASAVGIGRGFLYSFCAYGQDGVEHAFKILRDEFEMNMRLLGITKLSDIKPEMVDARALSVHTAPTPADNLFNSVCEYKICLLPCDVLSDFSSLRPTTQDGAVQGI
jgi:L-lactate dehydrogenase (cytochrome)